MLGFHTSTCKRWLWDLRLIYTCLISQGVLNQTGNARHAKSCLWFIMILFVMYLFYSDDSLNSHRFTMRTIPELTKCFKPVQYKAGYLLNWLKHHLVITPIWIFCWGYLCCLYVVSCSAVFNFITQKCPPNILHYFTAVKMIHFRGKL